MTRSTPSTPPPHSLSDEDEGSPRLRRSPRIKLGVEVIEKKKGVRSGKKNKVSKNSVPCKTIKVKPNLGRAAGSKEDPPLGDKKTKEAVSTRRVEQDELADSEEDGLGEDNGDDGGKVRSVNKNHKVSKNDVPCKTNKVKPNLGRAAGSREDPPRGDKKSKEAVSTRRVEQDELADSEEDGLGEDDGDNDADKDNDDGGADDDDNSDNDDADYHSEEGEGESDDEDEIEDGQDPMLESDQGDSSDDEEIKRTDKDRRGTTALFSQQKFRDYVKKVKSSRNQERELTKKPRLTRERNPTDCQTASKSATPTESSGVDLDQIQLVHAYTRKESARLREGHVATRVRSFVKNVMFRTIKFVNSEAMIERAMKTLYKFENVKEHKKLEFHRLYESVFNDALNTKRSACEQAGGKIVKELLKTMDPDELFTVEELCKLRRSTTEREKQAFYWFFSTFLECVCGKKAWGKLKYTSVI
jgi:hypothetical protein